MKKNLLLIINPKAGSIDVDDVSANGKLWAETYQFELTIHTTTGNDDKKSIEALLKKSDFERVLVAGGDGTINMVASILVGTSITLAILACGSANGLATSFELPKDLDEQFKIALDAKPKSVDTLEVNGNLCIHIADVGVNAELIYNYETTKSSGLWGYAMQTIPTLFKSDYPYHFDMELDSQTFKTKGVLLAFANADRYGTGSIINPDGKIDDGVFEVVIFKRLSLIDILKTFFKKRKRQNLNVEIHSTASVTVRCRKPISFQVDGEFIGKVDTLSATINPASLKMAIPDNG